MNFDYTVETKKDFDNAVAAVKEETVFLVILVLVMNLSSPVSSFAHTLADSGTNDNNHTVREESGGMSSAMMSMMSMMMAPLHQGFTGQGGGGNSMMGLFGFGWIFMILFWGFIILGIVALIKWFANQGNGSSKSDDALKILKQRYAKGEIDKKEFEEKKKDII